MTVSSNGSRRCCLFWAVWSEAWSIVAVSEALAEACLRRARARIEAGRVDLWKRVTTSRGLC